MPVLELHGVHKRYGDVEALAGVDLAVEQGEVVALLGPNGAGKTTAFEILLGLVRPTGGTVRVLGDRPGGAVRSRVGVMLQGAGLPEQVRVAELVDLIGRSYPASLPVADTLARVGLGNRARRTVTDLSGGERQRLLLAMALVAAPELLVLDEPTAAMDVESRRGFWTHARSAVRDGASVLFATHDLAEADDIADRVVVLQSGRVIADATPAELKRTVAATVMSVTTDAPPEVVRAAAGVERVEVAGGPVAAGVPGGRRLHVYAADVEDALVSLVTGGYRIAGVRVTDADLEDAFLHLTRSTEPAPAGLTEGGAR